MRIIALRIRAAVTIAGEVLRLIRTPSAPRKQSAALFVLLAVAPACSPSSSEGPQGSPSSALHPSCPAGAYAAHPLPDSVSFQTLCSGLTFAEGPTWSAEQNALFFSDFDNNDARTNYNGAIAKYDPESGCSVWLADAGSNGLVISSSGNVVACRHGDQTVTEFDRDTGQPRILASLYQDRHFSSPNDVVARTDGNLYFTDPAWNLGNRSEELPQAAYRLDPRGTLTIVEELDGMRPNGVALSPAQDILYVALSREIRQYDVDTAGGTSNPRRFASVGSDGLAVDCAGNVYVTNQGGQVFTANGELLGSLQAGSSITNLTFGGSQGKTLFVTAGSQLKAVELNIPGLP